MMIEEHTLYIYLLFIYVLSQLFNICNKRAYFYEYEFLHGNYLEIYGGCADKQCKQINFKITEMEQKN